MNHSAIHDLAPKVKGRAGPTGYCHAVAVEPTVHCCAFDAIRRLIVEYRKKLAREDAIGVATKRRPVPGMALRLPVKILLFHDRRACSCRPSDRMIRVVCLPGGYRYPTTLDSDSSNLAGATVTNLSAVTTKKAFRNLSDLTFQVMTSPWWQNQLSPGP